MIIGDHKKLATVIVAKLGKPDHSEAAPEDGGGDPLHDAAADFLHAVETKSAADLVDAFRAMFLACEQEPHSETESEGDSDPED